MGRLTKIILLSFLLGAGVGSADSLTLLLQEGGIRLLNPLTETIQLLVYYGILTTIVGVVGSFIFKKWTALSISSCAAAFMAFCVAYVWVHSRILVDNSMFSPNSLMYTGFIVIGSLVFLLAIRGFAKHKSGPILLLLFPFLPALLPLTKGVEMVTEPIGTAAADLPNVTFLLLDTQRADRLSCYGYERPDGKKTSPVIDGLAEQGVRFEWNYSAAPWTRPSVASMFSGLYPTSHGAYLPQRVLPEWTANMAEMFHEMGYRTAGFSTNPNISAVWGFAQGFQEFWCLDDKELIDMTAWGEAERKIRRYLKMFHETPDSARIVHEQVFPWVDRMKESDRPVFTYVQYLDPHFPYHPEEDIINDESPDFDALVAEVNSNTDTLIPYPFGQRELPPTHVIEGFLKLYDAEIAIMDREIGKLVERLKANGLLGENDWLIITSDHGEEFFEHNQWGHGQNVYQEVLRVPLIMVGPGIPEGMVIQTPVSLVDMLPTLAEAVDNKAFLKKGIKEPSKDEDGNVDGPILTLPGKPLQPLWENVANQGKGRPIYAEKLRDPKNYGLRVGDTKLVSIWNRELDDNEGAFYDVAYDVGSDPLEENGHTLGTMDEYSLPSHVSHRFTPLPEGLDEAIGQLLLEMEASTKVAGLLNQGWGEKKLTPDEKARLAEMGYLDPANMGGGAINLPPSADEE
jgi:arylsulfatase A-like enzyme